MSSQRFGVSDPWIHSRTLEEFQLNVLPSSLLDHADNFNSKIKVAVFIFTHIGDHFGSVHTVIIHKIILKTVGDNGSRFAVTAGESNDDLSPAVFAIVAKQLTSPKSMVSSRGKTVVSSVTVAHSLRNILSPGI